MDPEKKDDEKELNYEVEEGADLESTVIDHGQQTDNEAEKEGEGETAGTEEDESKDKGEESKDDTSHEDEVEQYSKGVKKRIDKLTFKLREAERREQAAIQYAQGVQAELEQNKTQMKTQVQSKDDALFNQYSQTIESQLSIAKENYKRAHESGDVDALMEAQTELARLAVEQENIKRVGEKRKAAAEQEEKEAPHQPAQQQQQAQYQQPTQNQSEPDEKAKQWAEDNPWFGDDDVMTSAAMVIHRKILSEGIDANSDLYYNRLNSGLKEAFPTKLGNTNIPSDANQPPAQQSVAGATRTSQTAKSSTKIKLTQSEIAMANKLGVPLEQYAKYKKTA